VVRERNIYRWAGNLIGELCAVRTEADAPPLLVTDDSSTERTLLDSSEKHLHPWVGGGMG
jgi:hypothetical protein